MKNTIKFVLVKEKKTSAKAQLFIGIVDENGATLAVCLLTDKEKLQIATRLLNELSWKG